MSKPYEKTRLWRVSFGKIAKDDTATADLANMYSTTWDRACLLAKRIAADAEGLTLHDEAHFTRLWECADIIVGRGYKLSPIETFIFGVAILIHDAAHTVLAFEGGISALSKTPEWRDALVAKCQNDQSDPNEDPTMLPVSLRKAVLFDTLRALHARQAKSILSVPFKHPALDANFYLLEDPTVRSHFGRLIGEIAASHHWNIARLETLGRQKNAIPPYHEYGPIRPMVLAALIRTADAIQIDAGRAPDFEFALTQPEGFSREHWTAQNRLSIAPDDQDPSALVVTSSVPFNEKEAKAWWIAFDLANTGDRELRASDQILRDAALPPFEITRVKDISDPTRFSKHVQTEGWVPINAEVRINDTGKIVQMFGGRGLYGDDDTVPLREMIQNAVDAVRARRILEDGFAGKVFITLRPGSNEAGGNGYWLTVADNGIGMSPAVLTGPFLAFGESGWSSSTLREERPGFLGSHFKRIGRFGIGFFSVFMVSEEVNVSTRPFDAGASAVRTLSFSSGLALRPIVKEGPSDFQMSHSTSVSLFIASDTKEKILHRTDPTRVIEAGKSYLRPATTFTLTELVGMLCPTIDVEIEIKHDPDEEKGTIEADWVKENGNVWLKRINCLQIENIPEVILDNIDYVETISLDNGQIIGRAALNPSSGKLAVYSIGGLGRKLRPNVDHGRHFVGCLDLSPRGPRRDTGDMLSKETIARWADRQVNKWLKADIDARERNFVAANAAYFGGDPLPIANCLIDDEWLTVSDVFERLKSGHSIYAPVKQFGNKDDRWSIMGTVNFSSGFILHKDDVDVTLTNVMVAGATADVQAYWVLPEDDFPTPFSFVGCLGRFALSRGTYLKLDGEDVDFGVYKGDTSRMLRLTHGQRLVLPGIRLSLHLT
ncbi:ATP-binding protein [Mesorhizobium sp.]|uniref:HD domain-containing protein n=1 Tax=Mesorhizobium sp. TaxID=1871066 RepID=UPI000FE87B22|nr:ATP-binding protein [Mesorhizobium sp.]RWD96980.1 MAG: hypothetical protein EOS40_30460 [Mesorhizobium sp.]TIU01003.1 MAG: hypothetical protein E5W55_01555 [Mesorhizobium sp.]